MTNVQHDPHAKATDRLGLTLFLATVIHGIIILGISFKDDLFNDDFQSSPLDVVLVHSWNEKAPDDANRIAQFNQQASGSTNEPDRPTNPLSSIIPSPSATGQAPTPQETAQQQVQLVQSEQFLHTNRKSPESVITQDKTEQQREVDQPRQREVMQRDMEIARLAAELETAEQRYSERPKIRFIDALSAKSAAEAKYIDDWIHRVEGIGNLNYPEQARQDRISGKLILNVLLDTSGKVLRVRVAVSSGSKVLDDAAVQIVKISSPFPAFPPEMRKIWDQMMITRTWSFNTDGG